MKKNALLAVIGILTVFFAGCEKLGSGSGRQVYYAMKLIPAGSFLMGVDSIYQSAGAVNTYGDTIHHVTVSRFSMDTTEVTQAEYRSLMGVNPSHFRDSADWLSRPVENVTWFDAVLYCNTRSKMEGKDTVYSYSNIEGTPENGCTALSDLSINYAKKGYRLPTEAEWEYACRGGTTTTYWWGADTNGMGARVRYFCESNYTTYPVATKLANAYGLYDMTGNVREWCNDWYGSYTAGAATDPKGATMGINRVLRGGSWYCTLDPFRSAYRYGYVPIHGYGRYGYFGFRCVLPR
ncbi:MAG: SUMF1/EgtB/PvdO family nonheme iron enzyme [Chitinispirillaceae bacterium]|jgi:formylglycine-generating enzyme required for sulfatase activity